MCLAYPATFGHSTGRRLDDTGHAESEQPSFGLGLTFDREVTWSSPPNMLKETLGTVDLTEPGQSWGPATM